MIAIAWLLVLAQASEPLASTPVGVSAEVTDLVLPGPELEAVPPALRDPVVLRVVEVYPHGSDFRYDLAWYGLEPGVFDLRDHLRRVDGEPLALPEPLQVEVRSVLPAGLVKPNPLEPADLPGLGGYRRLLWLGGIAWLGILVWGISASRRRRQTEAVAVEAPRTLADRLRPLIERAVAGELPREEHARLELSLIALWRRRLKLDEADPGVALATLRGHAEAGALLQALEAWLHRPEPPAEVDLAGLLAPYRDLAPEELD